MTSPSPAPPRSESLRKPPTVTLWVLQALLALFFVPVGYSHALLPFDEIARQATWMHDVPRWLSRFIGYAEIAGGLGLILPPALRLPPWLTPAAALGLATIMLLAIPLHVLKGEASVIWLHALIAALAMFVAWGRWSYAPIARRREQSPLTRPPITPVCVAELVAEGEGTPIHVHFINPIDARLQVDSGRTKEAASRLGPSQPHGFDRGGARNQATH